MLKYLSLALFPLCAYAGISVQVADGGLSSARSCGGRILDNVNENPGAPNQNSGCVSPGAFNCFLVLTATEGFQCNIFSDNTCQNFVAAIGANTVAGVGTPSSFPRSGESIQCFSQDSFDNPNAGTTARLTISSNSIDGEKNAGTALADAITTSCGDTGCDASATERSFTLDRDGDAPGVFGTECNQLIQDCGIESCKATYTVRGNYDNTAQRDYMKALLEKAGNEVSSANTNSQTQFSQVVLNDATGANLAEISVEVSVTCGKLGAFDCDGIEAKLIGGVLGEVPAVGGFTATIFDVTCAATSSKEEKRWVA
ncbi:hypothetical protein EJ04DRAFT_607115 [Polyplosphaeria fusca]|uniref:Uncharacterized protein n=1 Tax=Polyplosphaeria fusca TaxID=682080 RepID=A0A9P4UZT4_9PLEO|nr:hypothetical protein EJ04DRAFT_607115 [Polyplosphaeria fusca]